MVIGMIIAWIVVLSMFAGLAGTGLSLLFDLVIPGFIIYSIFKAIFSKNKKQNVVTVNPVTASSTRARTSGTGLTDAQRARVDRTLRSYFKDHDRLTITGDINLRPAGGQYTTLRDLDVYQKDDQVAKLSEFSGNFNDFYRQTMSLLNMFADQAAPSAMTETAETAKTEEKKTETPKKKTSKDEYDNAEEYINRINALNDEIPDEEISNGLYQVTAYLTQIQLIEKKFPEKHAKLKKVYHYYLPILIKILEQYRNFQDSAKGTAEFSTSEDQLKKTIVLINGALKMITETICAEDLTDLNANMTTLAMLLKNDGLVEEENKLTAGGK